MASVKPDPKVESYPVTDPHAPEGERTISATVTDDVLAALEKAAMTNMPPGAKLIGVGVNDYVRRGDDPGFTVSPAKPISHDELVAEAFRAGETLGVTARALDLGKVRRWPFSDKTQPVCHTGEPLSDDQALALFARIRGYVALSDDEPSREHLWKIVRAKVRDAVELTRSLEGRASFAPSDVEKEDEIIAILAEGRAA